METLEPLEPLEFRILGPLAALRDGQELDLGRPKQRAVLATLLIHRDRVVSLDHLADLLWGEERVTRATASLRIYVSNLRRVLEPERGRRAPCQVLVTQAPGYRLRVDPDQLDAARFEALAARGAGLLGDGRPDEACDTLTQALALARGPALAEFAFERFADTEASRLEELRAGVIENRLEAELALGHHATSVAELEGLVAERPLRERLWGLLIVALYRSGRQADALRAFSSARTMLAEELGIDPGPDLRRLEADVLAQSPSLDWQPPERRHPSSVLVVDAPPDTATPGVASPPVGPTASTDISIVGRARELACLHAALDEVMAGRGRIVLVAGEPGIGKTRLVEELAAVAAAQRAVVTWGRCQEVEGAPPYWPWVQVLRAVVAEGDSQAVRGALQAVAGEIAQIVPDVKELGIDIVPPPARDPALARFSLHGAVVEFLRRTAANGPMVIVLDDVHWADVASLELIGHVAGEVDRDSILVVATYRDVDPVASGPLADLLGQLARHRALDRVALGGLTRTEVATFIAQTADVTPTACCQRHGFVMLESWSRLFHGWAIAEQGRPAERVAEMTAALAIHDTTGARINTALFPSLLADGERRGGDDERALVLVDEALTLARTLGDRVYESELHRRRGELLATLRPDEALASFGEAVSIAEEQGAVAFSRRAEAALANLERAGSFGPAGAPAGDS